MADVKTPQQLIAQLDRAAIRTAVSNSREKRLDIINQPAEVAEHQLATELGVNPTFVVGETPRPDTPTR